MAGGFGQYLKDTRGELHHVAWPTRTQTIVYTAIVIGISVFTAFYLGFFDYLFTGTLKRVVEHTGGTSAVSAVQQQNMPQTTAPASATPIPSVPLNK